MSSLQKTFHTKSFSECTLLSVLCLHRVGGVQCAQCMDSVVLSVLFLFYSMESVYFSVLGVYCVLGVYRWTLVCQV